MDLEKIVEELSYEKKLSIVRFALEVAAADGEIDEEELTAIVAICSLKLGVDDLEDKIGTIVESNYKSTLATFSMDEATLLGFILGVIAAADGVVSSVEVRHIRSLLEQAGLNNLFIDALIATFENQ